MRSLRARLFASTLAALALTLALTLLVGGALTRREVDRSQASALAQVADGRALDRREHVSYRRGTQQVGPVLVMVQVRSQFRGVVPDVNRSSNGKTTYRGKRQLYSYRTLPHLGLLLLRPSSSLSGAVRPYILDLLFAGLAGVALAAILSFLVARSIARPLGRVVRATRSLAADERHEPLAPEGTSELAALAEAFNQMVEQLAASRAAEREFLLSVSHELKTPLTAIRGYAEGLAEGAFEPDEAARTIAVEAQRLERLVRDILDLARMNRAEFSVHREPVDLAEVVREAVRRHDAAAREFGVVLDVDARETWAEGDHDRVLQVVSNLIENALRATPAGGRVAVRVDGPSIVVSDTGAGIAPDDVPRAFERFYLYDRSSRARRVGSGLGLAIVKQLATAMGGDVRVESGAEGTTFTVRLRPQLRGVDDLEVGAAQRA